MRESGGLPISRLSNQERDLQMKTTAFALVALLASTAVAAPVLDDGSQVVQFFDKDTFQLISR